MKLFVCKSLLLVITLHLIFAISDGAKSRPGIVPPLDQPPKSFLERMALWKLNAMANLPKYFPTWILHFIPFPGTEEGFDPQVATSDRNEVQQVYEAPIKT